MSGTRHPTPAQWLALYKWVFPSGTYPRRHWKAALRNAWIRAGEGVPGYAPELQQLRNDLGPSWLERVTAQQIDRAALAYRVQAAADARASVQS